MPRENRPHYVWTEQLGPFTSYTFMVCISMSPPSAESIGRFPMWLWRHSYFTDCDNVAEARAAFERRVSNLRKLDFTIIADREGIR